MSELNIGKVIKALECCADDNSCYNGGCPYKSDELTACTTKMSRDALTLIKELTEENKRLSAAVRTDIVLCRARGSGKTEFLRNNIRIRGDAIRADTVSEIKTRFAVRFGTYTDKDMTPITEVFRLLDQITKEIMEDTEND